MKLGDVVKAIMSSLQQVSKSAQDLAQTESDPTVKAALSGVANTITPATSGSMPYSVGSAPPPTTITISQGGTSSIATLPANPSPSAIPLPSTVYTTPQPALPTPLPPTPAPAPAPMPMPDMSFRHSKIPSTPTLVTIAIVVLVGGISVFLAMSDTFAFLAFVVLASFIGFILYFYGFVQIKKTDTELDVTYILDPFEKPITTTSLAPIVIPPSTEVFYVSDNTFTYGQAPAVCKAYGATLASYSQVEEAYHQGGEWCGYGWTEGGIALFPTQQATFDKLQKEPDAQSRIKCGRPGVNGGYFDPGTQFGVNCYGVRPAKKASDKAPPTVADNGVDRLVGQFKQNLAKYVISPFNQNEWSEVSGNPQDIQLSQTMTPSAKPVPGATQPVTQTATAPTTTTPTATILSAIQTIPTPPHPAPADIMQTLEDLGSAPMGILSDVYDNVSEFVQELV